MENIVLAITTEIRKEVSENDIDLVKLKTLVDIGLHVQSMTINSISDITEDRQPRAAPRFAGVGQAMAYGPSSMERLLGELLPQVLPQLESKMSNDALSALVGLTNSYQTLQKQDPGLAGKLKVKIEALLDEKKEDTDETLHT
ncbi:MAG TPA: hypothetical protein ENI27_02850 [bacterium]|nr:hypothetical protein [bacterium]